MCTPRLAAKIGYALFCNITKRKIHTLDDERMRSSILGAETSPDEPVSIAPDPTTWTTSNDPHFVLLSPAHDRTAALVNLYCFSFRVELGEAGVLPNPAGVICQIDGSGMRIASEEEVANFTTRVEGVLFSRPWLRPASSDA